MAKLHILSKAERKAFSSPPVFTLDEKQHYFHINTSTKTIVNDIRSTTNKIGFILQLGYFKHTVRFFMANQFYKQDITFVAKSLNIDPREIRP